MCQCGPKCPAPYSVRSKVRNRLERHLGAVEMAINETLVVNSEPSAFDVRG